MANLPINVEIDERPFQIDYKENLAIAFKMFEEIKMDLDQETDDELKGELRRVDEMTQDILHIMELMSFNAVEGYNLSKMMQVVRKARRKIKDRIDEREKMKAIIKQYEQFRNNVNVKHELYQHLLKTQDKRSYRIRQLTELEGFYNTIAKQKKKMQESQIA